MFLPPPPRRRLPAPSASLVVVQRCTPKCTVFIGSRTPSTRRKLNAGRHLLKRARRPAAGAALCTDLHRLHCAEHGQGGLWNTSSIDLTNLTT
jgi:hypothetical protein